MRSSFLPKYCMFGSFFHSKLYWPLVVLGYYSITGLKAFSILFFTKFFFHAVWSDRTEEGINGSKLGNWVILDLNPPKRVWNFIRISSKRMRWLLHFDYFRFLLLFLTYFWLERSIFEEKNLNIHLLRHRIDTNFLL